jgi:type IV pilus assembly protein PilW
MKISYSHLPAHNAKSSKNQAGVSLIELMIALTLSLFLTIGMIKIFTSAKAIFHTQEGISQIQENQRIVMNRIIRDVSSAGYMGCLQWATPNIRSTLNLKTGIYDFTSVIGGDEGSNGASDTLYIRRAFESAAIPLSQAMANETDVTLKVDPTGPNYKNLDQGDLAVLSDCSDAVIFMITNQPAKKDEEGAGEILHQKDVEIGDLLNTTEDFSHTYGCPLCSMAKIYKVATTKYYITQSNSGNGTSLYVDSGRAEELIEGVSDFQVLYGIDSKLNSGVPTPSTYVTASAVTDWSDVISVKIELTLDTYSDSNLSKTVSTTIRLRNQVPS